MGCLIQGVAQTFSKYPWHGKVQRRNFCCANAVSYLTFFKRCQQWSKRDNLTRKSSDTPDQANSSHVLHRDCNTLRPFADHVLEESSNCRSRTCAKDPEVTDRMEQLAEQIWARAPRISQNVSDHSDPKTFQSCQLSGIRWVRLYIGGERSTLWHSMVFHAFRLVQAGTNMFQHVPIATVWALLEDVHGARCCKLTAPEAQRMRSSYPVIVQLLHTATVYLHPAHRLRKATSIRSWPMTCEMHWMSEAY